jgi:hypothetical protein
MRLINRIAFAVIVLALAPTLLSFADPAEDSRYKPARRSKIAPNAEIRCSSRRQLHHGIGRKRGGAHSF